MADERERDIHIRNGAVPPEQLRAAFDALGAGRVVIEDVPGAGREIEIHTRVAALLARLAEGSDEPAGATFKRLNDTLWAHLTDPDIRLLLVDTDTDISAMLAPGLPEGAHAALAALPLASVERFGIVAYDPARGAWVQVERRR